MKRDGFLGNFRFTQIAARPRAKKPRAKILVENFGTFLKRLPWDEYIELFELSPEPSLRLADSSHVGEASIFGHPDNPSRDKIAQYVVCSLEPFDHSYRTEFE